jgi:ribosomal protein S18 acetylase RimI-like enzyme
VTVFTSSDGEAMDVRRVRKDDAARLREIRLRALREAPYAFSSWFEREAEWPPGVWERRAADSEAAVESAVFVAEEGGRWLAIAGGYFPNADHEAATLWGLWVDPAVRRRGVAGHLVEAVADWARGRGVSRLELSVTDRARAAAALYHRLGFTETGERRLLASQPSVTEIFLARALEPETEAPPRQ